ncbi:hypothetical protein B0H15DRAFT_945259 [Mycena belliarum]|uniref:F-box domain-containing protein n=1 Tax=Mycena belliarum TaxID=1033014 RepID=A0AAD6XX37_9AGAR|nr:hypothetical protein B0H15DRAFT_945259 [Mycena belliae]
MVAPRRAALIRCAPTFWTCPDLVFQMLRFMSFVDLVKYSELNRTAQRLFKIYIHGRIARYTSPFFTAGAVRNGRIVRLFQVLEQTSSWVVGSVPLAVVSVLSDVPQPGNLNIITLEKHAYRWLRFFIEECGFGLDADVWASGAYAAAGFRYITFVHPSKRGQQVTVTTSEDTHLGSLFFAAPNTDQQIAIAAHQIISPYPTTVSDQAHLAGLRPAEIQHPALPKIVHSTYRETARFPGATTLSRSTVDLGRPCGKLCPGVWRSARGLKGVGRVMWGGADGMDWDIDLMLVKVGHSRLKFRLGVKCENPLCKTSVVA